MSEQWMAGSVIQDNIMRNDLATKPLNSQLTTFLTLCPMAGVSSPQQQLQPSGKPFLISFQLYFKCWLKSKAE